MTRDDIRDAVLRLVEPGLISPTQPMAGERAYSVGHVAHLVAAAAVLAAVATHVVTKRKAR